MKETDDEAGRSYHGEFRYVNLGPAQIRRKLESEEDPAERTALGLALDFWQRKSPAGAVSGQPYRGTPREAIHADSVSDLVKDRKPVEYVSSGGTLVAPVNGEVVSRGGVIDVEGLMDGKYDDPDDDSVSMADIKRSARAADLGVEPGEIVDLSPGE